MPYVENNDVFRRNLRHHKLGSESDWMDATLIGKSHGIFFAVILKEGFSAALLSDTQYQNSKEDSQLGDSIQVKIREILDNDPRHRTRHYVTVARLCPDFAENVRVVGGARSEQGKVYFETTAQPAEYAKDGKTLLLYNDRFENEFSGWFIDKNRLLPSSTRTNVTFEFISTYSPSDKSQTIFLITKIIKSDEPQVPRFTGPSPEKQENDWDYQQQDYRTKEGYFQDYESFDREEASSSSGWDRTESVHEVLFGDDEKREFFDLMKFFYQYANVRSAMEIFDPKATRQIEKFIALGP
ncbi:hypothetical protein WR25_15179 [Diploscapter pachys]|uniref:Uncharacterized protein n=1 Tax=Diploscapter pachys TaxID=2018661 RepID=A0A2A2KPD7_9BILA|nr:hypothetical protein WR25_15179 [Diploscapter pachys]